MIILKVLCGLPFKRKQPLKSVDDQYTRILKNKEIWDDVCEIKTTKGITPCDLNQESELYLYVYSATENGVMVELYLHDFYLKN
jgi:hypothetical protein